VFFYEPIDRNFDLFDVVERHVCGHRKTSCMSLVLTRHLVKSSLYAVAG
jgi:hypothetical protein